MKMGVRVLWVIISSALPICSCQQTEETTNMEDLILQQAEQEWFLHGAEQEWFLHGAATSKKNGPAALFNNNGVDNNVRIVPVPMYNPDLLAVLACHARLDKSRWSAIDWTRFPCPPDLLTPSDHDLDSKEGEQHLQEDFRAAPEAESRGEKENDSNDKQLQSGILHHGLTTLVYLF
eukprot:Protomagalhaensia_wolfi_Nauph_80__3683@NODE_3716_length_728_cov_4_275762_g2929_i0_p1_GENE_NODE_3716_length_728_cov_4_275762_g2929_i0NODE_3716_length_728_cov_4_275762_g2929_i0_p1_ORF_typecomplete_len177_score22_69_NODE_3716_length_728_cov_4_275762_g2929_i052582